MLTLGRARAIFVLLVRGSLSLCTHGSLFALVDLRAAPSSAASQSHGVWCSLMAYGVCHRRRRRRGAEDAYAYMRCVYALPLGLAWWAPVRPGEALLALNRRLGDSDSLALGLILILTAPGGDDARGCGCKAHSLSRLQICICPGPVGQSVRNRDRGPRLYSCLYALSASVVWSYLGALYLRACAICICVRIWMRYMCGRWEADVTGSLGACVACFYFCYWLAVIPFLCLRCLFCSFFLMCWEMADGR